MDDRQLLGPADVDDTTLARMVADQLGRDPDEVTLLDSHVEVVAYDVPSITTAGRFWVRGQAETPDGPAPYSFFVKHVQSWSRSPLFGFVPPEVRELAAAGVPWRTEPLVYRSDLAARLPAGLSMPRVAGVFDLDDQSASVWLEEVPARADGWTREQFGNAATLLGRLAASPGVADLAGVGEFEWRVRTYLEGRLTHQVLPLLRSPDIWQHPLVAGAFDADLRDRLLAAADAAPAYTRELDRLPYLTGHGDACPGNLLVVEGVDGFVLIDFGFWNRLPVGFDLGQLLVGDVQVGRLDASRPAELEEECLAAYVTGLRDEGCEIPADVVRRAHALQLVLFTGLSALPFEHLESEPTAALHRDAAQRAALAHFSLDLVDATSQDRSSPG